MTAAGANEGLSVRFSRQGESVVVYLVGELDAATAPVLQHVLADVIDDQGNLAVRLELGEMAFIDSTGLSVLVGALRRLRGKGGHLSLANVRRETLRVFEMVGFTTVFDIAPQTPGVVVAPLGPIQQAAHRRTPRRHAFGPAS